MEFHLQQFTVQLSEMGSASANELIQIVKSDEGDKSGTVTKLSPTMVYRSSCGKHKERK